MDLDSKGVTKLVEAAQSSDPVSGLTHRFYRYPARFTPELARTAIEIFTDPGEMVVDPFMGSGTSLVEARAANRRSVGTDVNSLACFLAKVKTRIYSDEELSAVRKWILKIGSNIHCQMPPNRATKWIEQGYLKNIRTSSTWPIRKLLELAIGRLSDLETKREEELARCILLRTGQWALDCRQEIPSATDFRKKLRDFGTSMCDQARRFREKCQDAKESSIAEVRCHNVSAEKVEGYYSQSDDSPKLIITSPPYPGVHVLYHRWQIKGRRETPAPFWIANRVDGHGESYYTMGGRHEAGRKKYFRMLRDVYKSLAEIAGYETIFVTVISFSDPKTQKKKFIDCLSEAGLSEVKLKELNESVSTRIQRSVPNRKWYNDARDEMISTEKENVMIHKLGSEN